ncbi:MAG: metallophosphoesterase family protein [Microgenomates group bacterium]
MKILVISDSHGNIANLKHVMGFGKNIGVEAVIHCGDWDNLESVKTVLSFDIPLYTVLGNADIDLDIEECLKFNADKFDPYLLKFEIDGRKIGIIHEAKMQDEKLHEFKVVFSGHHHSKEEKTVNWTKFIRPGALINGTNFAVYETVTGEVEFINE